MILHRITAIFAGINRDFTGTNHADLAARYGIPLPQVFQVIALAHQLKTKSRIKTEPDILEVAATISDITRTVDGKQALTTAQTLRIANLVRTGGVVDTPIQRTPWEKGRAEQRNEFGFPVEAPVIGAANV